MRLSFVDTLPLSGTFSLSLDTTFVPRGGVPSENSEGLHHIILHCMYLLQPIWENIPRSQCLLSTCKRSFNVLSFFSTDSFMVNKKTYIPVVDGVLAAVLVRALVEAVAISSLGRVWGGLYCATGREGFSLAARSKLASLSIRNLQRKRQRGIEIIDYDKKTVTL